MKANFENTRALAVQQPFAALITHTHLLVRSWYTPFRGQVLIGSTIKEISDLRKHCNSDQHEYLQYLALTDPLFDKNNCALFLADLAEVRPLTMQDAQRAQTLFKKNHWCFLFKNITMVAPFHFHGHHRTLRTLSPHASSLLTLGLGKTKTPLPEFSLSM